MAVKDWTNSEIDALVGARESKLGTYLLNTGDTSYHYRILNNLLHLIDAAAAWFSVREDDNGASSTTHVRILPGRVRLAGETLAWSSGALAGTTSGVVDLSSYTSSTAYLWLYSNSGTITIGAGTSWPSYAHIKLAEVTLDSTSITAITDRRPEFCLRADAQSQMAMAAGTWAIDGDGAETNGGGIVGHVIVTEQAAALCVVEDYDAGGSDYQLLSSSSSGAGYTSDYQLLPDTEAVSDAVYFGGAIPFCELAIDMDTNATHTSDSLVWEYWDGSAWSTLTLTRDSTDTTAQDGKRSFQRDGAIAFIPPSDWATTSVNSQSAYWVRARVTGANLSVTPTTNSTEHSLITPADAIRAATTGLITELRASDLASTLHTATDVKFILVNFTTGATTSELTWAQDLRVDRWTSLSLAVTAGDELGVLVTQEDGTNEIENAMLEILIAPT